MTFMRAATFRVLGITERHSSCCLWQGRSRAAMIGRGGSLTAPLSSSLQRSPHVALEEKGLLVERLLMAKRSSGKTYDDIADSMGLTNAYVAQLFLNQAQLRPERVESLRKVVPELSDSDISDMQRCPYRSFEESVRDEPLVYRLLEAVLHYGEGLKSIVNEKFGDGIMSAIDFYLTVDKIKGAQGEDRVVITFNGKFLPHIEQTKEGASAGEPKP
eukprot:jgi/Undpi1/4479/HiC_scaffold_17.g07833.m1